ncbi:ABC transporter permease [Alcanivorax sp. 1008]|uniref:ABC transporter permease n=1 Tax=Alcanivorax sp. 1008 TaxID=2816853 RepID=UPI001D397EAD|nr:ABC transporter permease [Alcanivorax sp. 1008]MCC1496689.1 ABC transporter permease [Alcanivorax sp. 1008]
MLIRLAGKSLANRRGTALLVVLSMALSVALLLGVERLRDQVRDSFASTVSGVDLIVGARSGPLNLLLYSVFRIGEPTANVSWKSVERIAAQPQVDWVVPLSLGDSHRGFPVLGTSAAYFDHYRYARQRSLEFADGEPFDDLFDAVVGANVAQRLGYQLGQEIALSHGGGKVSLIDHADKPFRIVGILAATGTPVDNTVHVSLQGIEAIHADWLAGAPLPGMRLTAEQVRERDLRPRSVTALMVGLKSRIAVFQVQRSINTAAEEPLLAIIPGVALQQLWQMMALAENALALVAWMVVMVAVVVMLTALLTALNERRREMAILRAIGARPWQIFALVIGESLLLTLLGVLAGVLLLQLASLLAAPWVSARLGLALTLWSPVAKEFILIAAVMLAALLAGVWPAWRAYRQSLTDGLGMRL